MKYSFLDHVTLTTNFGPISPTSINHIFNAADCIIEAIYLHRVHFRFSHCCRRTRDESNKQFRNILYFKISMQVEGITSSACLVDSICIYRNIKTIEIEAAMIIQLKYKWWTHSQPKLSLIEDEGHWRWSQLWRLHIVDDQRLALHWRSKSSLSFFRTWLINLWKQNKIRIMSSDNIVLGSWQESMCRSWDHSPEWFWCHFCSWSAPKHALNPAKVV